MNSGDNMESNVDFHIKDEAERLIKEIELMMMNVENSKFYDGMRCDLKKNETIRKHLFRLLGSHSHAQVVIYGLGSIEFNFNSQFQLAVILLLKREFSNWIGDIEIYDAVMSPADIIVFKELGLEVLTTDENCKRTAQGPTMFYMPNMDYYLIGNLLGANWSSSSLNQIFLLTNSFHDRLINLPRCNRNNLETMIRLEGILELTTEIGIKTCEDQMYVDLFSGFAWHFFHVDPNSDIDKPGSFWLAMQRYLKIELISGMISEKTSEKFAQILSHYRVPRHFRCNSVPLLSGWVKLNIYGIGTKGDQPGRFSGVFQNKYGKCLGRYRGNIDVEDNVIVGLVALMLGLVRCEEGKPNAEKLIVESDNFMLVQYVNGCPEPNKKTKDMLKGISNLLKHVTCVVYHVYKEANEAARDWALRDECPNNGPNAASERKLYVGNLHFNMTELRLRQIFEAFGPVELVQLPTDPETGYCKGFGFVQFAQLEHAKAAKSLNDKLEIAGCTILVSSVTEHVGVQDAGAKTADFDDDGGGL